MPSLLTLLSYFHHDLQCVDPSSGKAALPLIMALHDREAMVRDTGAAPETHANTTDKRHTRCLSSSTTCRGGRSATGYKQPSLSYRQLTLEALPNEQRPSRSSPAYQKQYTHAFLGWHAAVSHSPQARFLLLHWLLDRRRLRPCTRRMLLACLHRLWRCRTRFCVHGFSRLLRLRLRLLLLLQHLPQSGAEHKKCCSLYTSPPPQDVACKQTGSAQ